MVESSLSQFLILAKSARGNACIELVRNVLSASNVYVFGELLVLDSIKELAGKPEAAPYLHLLEIFAYGTYGDYKANQSALPPLSPEQEKKLKKLSLVSLCSQNKDVKYNVLLEQLEISHVRQLEDLVIECIYDGLVDVKLDQKRGELHVHSAMGRDVRLESLDGMIQTLCSWRSKAENLMDTIKDKVSQANETQEAHVQDRRELGERIAKAKKDIKSKEHQGDVPGMDFDGDEEGRTRGGKRSKAKHTSSSRERLR